VRFPRRLPTEWIWLAALLLLVSLHFWFPRLESGFEADSYGIGGEGRKAFFQLLQTRYGTVARSSTPLATLLPRLNSRGVLCVLGPARNPTEQEWNALLDCVFRVG
jgi:hypothetical protein